MIRILAQGEMRGSCQVNLAGLEFDWSVASKLPEPYRLDLLFAVFGRQFPKKEMTKEQYGIIERWRVLGFKGMFDHRLFYDSDQLWQMEMENWCKTFLSDLQQMERNEYVRNVWRGNREFLTAFAPLKFNRFRAQIAVAFNPTLRMAWRRVQSKTICDAIPDTHYTQEGTATGRVHAEYGVSLLSIPRRLRYALEPISTDCALVETDLSGMEPREFVAHFGRLNSDDPYETILSMLAEKTNREIVVPQERSQLKTLVMGALYGASYSTVKNMGGNSVFYSTIRDLTDEFGDHKRENRYGRPLLSQSGSPVANYFQSSGADGSLQFFHGMWKEMNNIGIAIQPALFIHDSVLWSVPKHQVSQFSKLAANYTVQNNIHRVGTVKCYRGNVDEDDAIVAGKI